MRSSDELIRSEIGSLRKVIADAGARIQFLQESCRHPGYQVGWWSWRPGAMEPRKICDVCHAPIGCPSAEEERVFRAGSPIGGQVGLAGITITATD